MRRISFLLACCLCLAACREPATAVMVIVTADFSVERDTQRVRYVVRGGPGTNMLGPMMDADTQTPGPGSWPVIIPIVPRDNDATRAFSIEIYAVGTTGDVVIARAISGFTHGETRALHIHLQEACRAAFGCPETETCDRGVCRDAFRQPSSLPLYSGFDAGTPSGDGGMSECGNGRIDGTEICDDGNIIPGDGCEPGSCDYSCFDLPDCVDANDCTEDECTELLVGGMVSGQVCTHAAVPDGNGCETSGGLDGMCTDGECIGAGCGDGVWQSSELCYDSTGFSDYGVVGASPGPVIAAGDFDGDRRTDLLLGGPGFELVAVRNIDHDIATGEVVFNAIFTAPSPPTFGAGDADGNGFASMFAPNYQGCGASCFSQVEVDFPAANLLERAMETFDGPIFAVGTGDLDGDSRQDFAVSHFSPTFIGQMGVTFLHTDAAGGFSRQGQSPLEMGGSGMPIRMTVGSPAPGFAGYIWVLRPGGMLENYEYFGDSMGFANRTSHPIDTGRPAQLTLGELVPGGVRTLFLTAMNTAGEVTARALDPMDMRQLNEFGWGAFDGVVFTAMGDVDNDDDADLVIVTEGSIQVLLGIDPNFPNFILGPNIPVPCTPVRSAVAADFNNDFAPDLALATDCGLLVLRARP